MTVSSKSHMGTQNELINFELSKTSPMHTAKTTQNNNTNLEKAYEELEKEIFEIKNKLQKSLNQSQYDNMKMDPTSRTNQGRANSNDRTGSGRVVGRISTNMKSPGDLDEHDYSLSVSDLGNSLYNTSQGGFGTAGHEVQPPRFKY